MSILVVGAGPTGLTAALELARRGREVEVIDRKANGSTLSRAVGILPASLRCLAPSGVTPKLLAEGVALEEVRFFLGRRPALQLSLRSADTTHGYILALPQDRTEALLRDALLACGGSVRYDVELQSLRQEDELVIANTTQDGERSFEYVIGADGIGSTTREQCGLAFPGYDLPEPWSIADVDARNWPHADAFSVCRSKVGKVSVVAPIDRDRYRVVSNTDDALECLPLELDVQTIRRAGTFRISIRQVEEYRHGRIFLAGDAAHCHSPVGGRGMNLGIADGADLAQRLVEGGLDGYSAARRTEGKRTIAGSERMRKFMTSKNPIVRALVPLGMGALACAPALRRRLSRNMLQGSFRGDTEAPPQDHSSLR